MSQAEPESQPEGEPETYPETEAEPESKVEPEGPAEPEAITEPSAAAEFSSEQEKALWISLYVICMLLIVIGDILIIITILKNRSLRRKASNLYLLSLILARTMIGILVVPTRITSTFSEEYLGSVACKLCHFSALGSSATSIISVVAVALDKYSELVTSNTNNNSVRGDHNQHLAQGTGAAAATGSKALPEKAQVDEEKEKQSLRRACLSIAFMWLLGHVYALRAPFVNDMVEVDHGGSPIVSCTLRPDKGYLSKWFALVDFVCLFIVPLCIITYCYIKVISLNLYQLVSRSKAEGEAGAAGASEQTNNEVSLKTSKMLVVIMGLFILCNLPPYILQLVVLWGHSDLTIAVSLEQAMYLASYSNSWLNVLVYLVYRKDLRAGLRALCTCCYCSTKGVKIKVMASQVSKELKF